MVKNNTNLEISKDEYAKVNYLLNMCSNTNIELECIIDKRIDINTFRNIMARLRSMDDIFINEEKYNMLDIQFIDSATGKSLNNIRRTISGLDNIVNYCTNDIFENYTDVYKKKKLDSFRINSYDIKFNLKYEIDIDDDLSALDEEQSVIDTIADNIYHFKQIPYLNNIPKVFRKKERHTFTTHCYNFKVDLTIVKASNVMNTKLSGSNIFDALENYEIEIEFTNEKIIAEYKQDENITFSEFLTKEYPIIKEQFFTYIGYILQVVNNSSYLITNEEKYIVRTKYLESINSKLSIRDKYISPNPVSISHNNLNKDYKINILNNEYSVTDKADGESRLLFIPSMDIGPKYRGRVYLINNILDITYTGITVNTTGKKDTLTILNGEFIQKDYSGKTIYDMACYDAYIINGVNLIELNLFSSDDSNTRLANLNEFIKQFSTAESIFNIYAKNFYYSENLYEDNNILWTTALDKGILNNVDYPVLNNYKLDGLIFTPNKPLVSFLGKRWDENLKWKPAEENTIDFLIEIVDNFNYKYKIVHLYCGKKVKIDGNVSYIKTKFNGNGSSKDISSYICFLEKDRYNNIVSKDGLPLYTDTIVEFRYNINSSKDNNYKWVPLRTRYDKTREYKEKTKNIFGNDIVTAKNNWISIHNPITINMISSDSDKYYSNKTSGGASIPTLRNYHNFIKRNILDTVTDRMKTNNNLSVLDIGCGRGGDIHKYYDNKQIKKIIGIDKSGHCIDEAIRRFKTKKPSDLKAQFFKADCKYLLNSKKAYDDQSSYDKGTEVLDKQKFDIISMQFCIHYFFDKEESLNNLIENIDTHIQDKGYFIGTCMNRDNVITILNGKNQFESLQGNNVLWRIKKEDNQLDTYGTKINVFIESIGKPTDEWLVNFNELTYKLAEKNIHLIPNGLREFDENLLSSFKIKDGGWDIYMSDAEKKFSELNQYFIFQKNGYVNKSIKKTKGGNNYENQIDKILTKDEQQLLLHHCNNCTDLDKFIKKKETEGFWIMEAGKPKLKNIQDLDIDSGKTCGLKKTALNAYGIKLGINLHTLLSNGKIKKKKKDELNNEILNKLTAHNIKLNYPIDK